MTSSEPAAEPDSRLAEFVAQRTAQSSEAARAVRDEAAAAGTLVWDPYDPAWVEDPYAVYAELRQHNPVHRNALGFWVFTRHADCLAILRDRRSSSDGRNVDESDLPELRAADLPARAGARGHVGRDGAVPVPGPSRPHPPAGARAEGVHPEGRRRHCGPGSRRSATGLLDDALERGEVDLVADYAYPLPVQIIVEMLGRARSRTTSSSGCGPTRWPGVSTPTSCSRPRRSSSGWVPSCRSSSTSPRSSKSAARQPGDDLLTRLIQAEEQGDVLTQAELLSTCILLLVAGHETTVNLISGGALALIEHPDQLARVRDDPAVVRSAVEEMLRFVCPGAAHRSGRARGHGGRRGARLSKGEFSMLLIGSANRDPAAFADPETFDVARTDNNHLGFGFGIHHCLGAPLARLEARSPCRPCCVGPVELERVADDALLQGEHRAPGPRVPSRPRVGLSLGTCPSGIAA